MSGARSARRWGGPERAGVKATIRKCFFPTWKVAAQVATIFLSELYLVETDYSLWLTGNLLVPTGNDLSGGVRRWGRSGNSGAELFSLSTGPAPQLFKELLAPLTEQRIRRRLEHREGQLPRIEECIDLWKPPSHPGQPDPARGGARGVPESVRGVVEERRVSADGEEPPRFDLRQMLCHLVRAASLESYELREPGEELIVCE